MPMALQCYWLGYSPGVKSNWCRSENPPLARRLPGLSHKLQTGKLPGFRALDFTA